MPRAGLDGPVRSQGEDEPADQRGADPQPQRPEPEEREPARADVAEQHERVPGEDGPEQRVQRAEDGAERPGGEVEPLLDFRLEAVRVAPRLLAPCELVSREPQLPDGLEMVARGRRAGPSVEPLGEEVRPRVAKRRPRRDDAGREEDAYDEPDNARAAESSSSRSGTSPSSKAHAPRTVPPRSIRNAVRCATSCIPR